MKAQGPKLKIINLNTRYNLNKGFIKELASSVLKYLKKGNKAEIEFVFLSDKEMRGYNKKYKDRDSSTDVLSFCIDTTEFGFEKMIGEIFISTDRAQDNAKLYGTSFEEETALYLIHGILHLFGYDDEAAPAKRRMEKKQYEALDHICTKKDLSKVLMPR